jgi:23S rRNA pseudouridine1911/1915/1917 synthase
VLQVLFEDNHFIAVNKPAGILVQGDQTGDRPLSEFVKSYIRDRYNKPGAVFLGVVHRIDRPVSGVVIFARTSKGLERLNKLFREREIQKTYWAITAQRPEPYEGHLEHYIVKDHSRNVAKAFDKPSRRHRNAKKAVLDYKLLSSRDGAHLIEVKPLTGRPHQIRVQLSELGCPIRGDLKYRSQRMTDDGSICLHSRNLTFLHPVKKEQVSITADIPEDNKEWQTFADLNDA